jgi:hypothetical protein
MHRRGIGQADSACRSSRTPLVPRPRDLRRRVWLNHPVQHSPAKTVSTSCLLPDSAPISGAPTQHKPGLPPGCRVSADFPIPRQAVQVVVHRVQATPINQTVSHAHSLHTSQKSRVSAGVCGALPKKVGCLGAAGERRAWATDGTPASPSVISFILLLGADKSACVLLRLLPGPWQPLC